jgi:septal ring factor EnvC (AmiA/AmiB activator)
MTAALPTDLAAAHAMILAERAARLEAQAVNASTEVLIAHLKLEIEKLRRAVYGNRSERKNRLLEQMECSWRSWRSLPPRTNWRREQAAAQSTLADQVGACTTALAPLHALIEAHVLAAERLYGDDTTVPILAKGKTVTGHI